MLFLCALITIGCYWNLNQSYDPLARYPYGSESQRAMILDRLDNREIDYLISQHIRPKVFINFIDVDGFDIYECQKYYTAQQTQDESSEFIVNFVNKYSKYFSLNDLEVLLKHYTYADLMTFYENDLVNNSNLILVNDPTEMYVLLDENHSVYRYQPSSLENYQGVLVNQTMIQNLDQMRSTYMSMMNGQDFQIQSGFRSYDEINEWITELSSQYSMEDLASFVLPAGQNEAQLGYTISLMDQDQWISLCLNSTKVDGEFDYSSIIQSLSESQRDLMLWLEENAYRYGFVIRYPMDKTDTTQMAYQPFVLRYVGRLAARQMHAENKCMEEMNFSEFED